VIKSESEVLLLTKPDSLAHTALVPAVPSCGEASLARVRVGNPLLFLMGLDFGLHFSDCSLVTVKLLLVDDFPRGLN
jgi:hypothetical protein